jgi:cation transport regulator
MPYQTIDELPGDIKDKLQDGAAPIFMAAFNSAQKDGMSEDGAMQVAWNTIKNDYQQGADGSWHRKPDDTNQRFKSVQSGGN